MSLPTPHIDRPSRLIEFEFPGLLIGTASYREGPTGCTLLYFADGAVAVADVAGGSPGMIALGASLGHGENIDAICLCGGSVFGLEAVCGVNRALLERRGSAAWNDVPHVLGAVIYDFAARNNHIHPDVALGRAALESAVEGVFPLGRVGAGSAATVGKEVAGLLPEPGGQGGAFRRVGRTRIAAFTVVNAVGAVVDRAGNVVRGNLDAHTGERRHRHQHISKRRDAAIGTRPSGGNTTLTVVVTNRKLDAFSHGQLAKQVHASLGRAIQPYASWSDGDILFAVTTNEINDFDLSATDLGVIASELAWDAVLAAVAEEPTDDGTTSS